MKLIDFLNKETPTYGGCMLCLATYSLFNNREKTKYLLIERSKSASGDMFIINNRLFYDYDYVWDNKTKDWEILYKKEI